MSYFYVLVTYKISSQLDILCFISSWGFLFAAVMAALFATLRPVNALNIHTLDNNELKLIKPFGIMKATI